MQENLVKRVAFATQHALDDLDAGFAQLAHALACHQRIGVGGADHHADQSRVDKCLRTGRLLAGVAAGFQRDVDSGASHIDMVAFRGFERAAFRMPTAEIVMMAGGDDTAVAHDDGAHHRIGIDLACSELRVA